MKRRIIIASTAFVSLLIVSIAAFIVLRWSLPLPSSLTPPSSPATSELGFYNGIQNSLILDRHGDAKPEQEYDTDIVPEVKGYHDILWAGVKKRMDGTFLLTVQLAGPPNLNERYETNYVWHIVTREHAYTVLFPNFAQDANFTTKGWYFAVYDNTANRYIVPMTQISNMPKEDMVEFPLDASYIGNPSSFYYWVSVHVRVDTKNLDKPPDYLMDYAPWRQGRGHLYDS